MAFSGISSSTGVSPSTREGCDVATIELEDVSKTYDANKRDSGVEAVRNVSMHVGSGEFVSIVGPTGCGKSTLMEIVAGLTDPTAGEVTIAGEPVTGPRRDVGVVFQKDSTFPWRTVLENVEFGLQMHGVTFDERRERSRDVIELVGLSGFEDTYPNELSGGMRQRVAIARTLVMNPAVMLMDEPFGALDEQTRIMLGDELLSIAAKTEQTTLFITHSINEAIHLSDRVVVMSARPGQIKETVGVDIPRPRSTDVFGSERFNDLSERVWELLKPEAESGLQR
ncbi:nitrate ABC transporter ATP-binding protein [Halobacteriales archaeon SW_10_66_29]|nr:MAG: nitrate ABC transporter ATP-binding protein [Halobacteriales archaeon SW_10_66_29]